MKRKGSARERDAAPRNVSLKHPNGLTGYQKGCCQVEVKCLLPSIQCNFGKATIPKAPPGATCNMNHIGDTRKSFEETFDSRFIP
jgi:hypothetical protein